MTVESNDAIAISALSGWLKSLAVFSQLTRSKTKTKTNRILYARFFPRVEKVRGNS